MTTLANKRRPAVQTLQLEKEVLKALSSTSQPNSDLENPPSKTPHLQRDTSTALPK